MELVRWLAVVVLVLFGGYTLYCWWTESFWKSLKIIWALKWGRQVTVDLYVGLLFFGFIVYMVEGSISIALAWILPALFVGNPITLIYFILNFDKIVAHFQQLS